MSVFFFQLLLFKCLHQFPPEQFSVSQLSSTGFSMDNQSLLISRQPGLVWTVENHVASAAGAGDGGSADEKTTECTTTHSVLDCRSSIGRVVWKVEKLQPAATELSDCQLPESDVTPLIEDRRRESMIALSTLRTAVSTARSDSSDKQSASGW